ncbi:Lar family restriction alleviation protein [Slackia piriformis]|nr:Lar family restriction alleviation protein [Slackia piriformis]
MSTNDLQANSDLLFCPFCGGEARFETYGGTACAVVCPTCGCGTPTMRLDDGMIAADLWNRRAERTCRMEYNEEWSGDELYPTECYNCSECHYMTNDGMPSYCPNCGAKVTGE